VIVAVDRLLTNRLKLRVWLDSSVQSINRGLFCNKVCNSKIVYNFKFLIGLLVKLKSNKLDFLDSFYANYIVSSGTALHSMKSDGRKVASP
jgi:hypothetical protein